MSTGTTRTLHIVPGPSTAGVLGQALRDAGRAEAVLACPDDLSCGPIDSDDPAARVAWWASIHDMSY